MKNCKNLLVEEGLTYGKTQKLLLILEATEWEVREPNPAKKIHSIGKHSSKKVSAASHSHKMCYRCDGTHLHSDCYFKQAEYHLCHKQGHITSVCWQKAKRSHKTPSSRRPIRCWKLRRMNSMSILCTLVIPQTANQFLWKLKFKMLQFTWKLIGEPHFKSSVITPMTPSGLNHSLYLSSQQQPSCRHLQES